MVKERELQLLPQSLLQHRYNSHGCRTYRQLQESTLSVICHIGERKDENERKARNPTESYIFIQGYS